ncbi:Endonuclease/exonuclease/phosphatase [Multifurca ochricompacta]|uniref:Endonuclease/exonuclease/phosphatase n=1 Tax=Multifurca ochricompacta TaxID=376703 RepID=A0AAD4QIX8_9AGAM|nr:Endonuclease/exonuclease/phosphatase [Multifurca ochricompacta]
MVMASDNQQQQQQQQKENLVRTGTPVRIATWNLRYDVLPDNIPVSASLTKLPDPRLPLPKKALRGEQPWSARRVRVAQRLLASKVDLVGFQEALIRQVDDLNELLGGSSEFGWVGVGRDDGVSAGEFSPIFYRRSAFTLLATDTFWLSNTPFTPGSIFPGAGCPRLATYARFRLFAADREEGNPFLPPPPPPPPPCDIVLLNTHLDHVSDDQRRLGAAMILHRARYEAAVRPGVSVLVTGTLIGASANGSDSGAYAVLTGAEPIAPAVPDEFDRRFPLPLPLPDDIAGWIMQDLRVVAPRVAVGGQWATFTGFEHRKEDEACIDFVFGRSDGGWYEARSVFVETALSDDGMLASDHRLVVADVTIVGS